MSSEPDGTVVSRDALAMLGLVGVMLMAFTVLFSFIYWMEEISSFIDSHQTEAILMLAAIPIASLLAILFGDETKREFGMIGLGATLLSVGFALADLLAEWLAPILSSSLPAFSPIVYALSGFLFGIILVGASLMALSGVGQSA